MQYQGVNGVARKVVKRYQGVGGVARQVIKAYTGVNGVARLYYVSGTSWQKWAVQCELETYYTESDWEIISSEQNDYKNEHSGGSDYAFDEITGHFSEVGSTTIPKNEEGFVYKVLPEYPETVFWIMISGVIAISRKDAIGPLTRANCTKQDTYYGTVMASGGGYPDTNKGYTYIDTFTEDDVEYVVMFDPQTETYYCYNKI